MKKKKKLGKRIKKNKIVKKRTKPKTNFLGEKRRIGHPRLYITVIIWYLIHDRWKVKSQIYRFH